MEKELSERELFNRAYMSEVIDRPPKTVEIGGQEVDSGANNQFYISAYFRAESGKRRPSLATKKVRSTVYTDNT